MATRTQWRPFVVGLFVVMLIPGLLFVDNRVTVLPVGDRDDELSPVLGVGDVFTARDPRSLAVDGRLPEADTISAELLDALKNPSALLNIAPGSVVDLPTGATGIPGSMLAAYRAAEQSLVRDMSGCGLHWSVIAGIGRVESTHARNGRVDASGTTLTPILGPRLSGGSGVVAIRDTDGGRLDGDAIWDRAVGPMQFIPGTWQAYGADGNADGQVDPHNAYDAALATGKYLCSGGLNLRDPAQLARAIFRYNHSRSYVRDVLMWAGIYAAGVTEVPSGVDQPVPIASPVPPVPVPVTPPPPGVLALVLPTTLPSIPLPATTPPSSPVTLVPITTITTTTITTTTATTTTTTPSLPTTTTPPVTTTTTTTAPQPPPVSTTSTPLPPPPVSTAPSVVPESTTTSQSLSATAGSTTTGATTTGATGPAPTSG